MSAYTTFRMIMLTDRFVCRCGEVRSSMMGVVVVMHEPFFRGSSAWLCGNAGLTGYSPDTHSCSSRTRNNPSDGNQCPSLHTGPYARACPCGKDSNAWGTPERRRHI